MKFVAVVLSILGLFFTVGAVFAQVNVGPAPGDVILVPPVDPVPPSPGPLPPKDVPEPSTLMLLGIGLAAGAGYKILKRK